MVNSSVIVLYVIATAANSGPLQITPFTWNRVSKDEVHKSLRLYGNVMGGHDALREVRYAWFFPDL